MKKQITIFALTVLITSLSFGQITTDPITGNVGIGTTSPKAKLDIAGELQVNGGAESFFGFGKSSSTKPIDARPNSQFPYVFNWHTGLTFSAHSLYGGIRFFNQGYPDMYGAGVLVMSINNNNVGIGTATPSAKLDVIGDAKINGKLTLGSDTQITTIAGPTNSGAIQIKSHVSLGGPTNRYLRLGWNDNNNVFNPAMSINDNLNVGIGTTTPSAKLDIFGGNSVATNLILSANYIDKYRWRFNTQDRGNAIDLDFTASDANDAQEAVLKLSRSTSGRPEFQLYNNTIVANNGNVGIGTSTPGSKLQVSGSITLPLPGTSEIAEEGITFIPNHRFSYDGKFINHYGFGFYPYSKSSDVGGVNSYMSGFYGLDFFTQDTNRIRIAQNGNVGIGTTDPKNKLSVNGTIWAKEVKVSLTDAADWVFDKNYKLKPLAEVERYIIKHKHLPEIPSADEFRQHDMNVSEMSNKLLQKVEELTLYAIEQKKEIERLKRENENYKSLAERLSAIEKELNK